VGQQLVELVLEDAVRIFNYVFGGLLIAIIVGIFGWYAREKIVLTIAGHQLKNDLASLKRLMYRNDGHSVCSTALTGYQLRFTSETGYVIEPVCRSLENNPIQEGVLPLGVKRLYGSGVLMEIVEGIPLDKDAWVHLIYGESQVAVGLFDGMAEVNWKAEDLTIGGESPAIASCADWGFTCCSSGAEVGESTKVRTYDCIHSCYQRCNRLPILLFFNTNPVLNQGSREVVVSKSDPVIQFGYEISDDQEGAEVEIDFGDGATSGPLSAKESDLNHEYRCLNQQCMYTASIRAKDRSGNMLVDTELSRIRVIVR
jgi:hypothetical protein